MHENGRTLAIETASEACSLALYDGAARIAHEHRVLGRGHAERLIPMIEALPGSGKADRILVSLGPGSFTGVRIGIAAARALGFAWGAQVLGYQTLALVSVRAWQPKPRPVTVCMNGGHGEWFVQNFDLHKPQDEASSLTPEQASKGMVHPVIVGNRASELAALLGDDRLVLDLLPDAGSVHLLHESALTKEHSPIYGRAPDATPQKTVAT